jgi:hypothetical protein
MNLSAVAPSLPPARRTEADIHPPVGTTVGTMHVTKDGRTADYDLVTASRASDHKLFGHHSDSELLYRLDRIAERRFDHNEGTTFAVLQARERGRTTGVELVARVAGSGEAPQPFLLRDVAAGADAVQIDADPAFGMTSLTSGRRGVAMLQPGAPTRIGDYWEFHILAA